MNKFRWKLIFVFISLLSLAVSCRLYNLEQKLSPEFTDFYSKVRYIITREEEKIFLELPDSEKPKFIEDFWKRRDPDPTTEENEFKIEYYNRIDRANQLFLGEGKPGWLTDRGRIYILFGPPQDRITNSSGESSYGRCSEVWYYGNFPIVFVDQTCSGNYDLATLNLQHLHDLNMALAQSQQTFKEEKKFFDFNWSVEKTTVKPDRIEGTVEVEIPYAGIWFGAVDGKLKTTLDVNLELKSFDKTIIWEHKQTFEIEMAEDELKNMKDKNYRIEIPLVLKEKLDKVSQGKNLMQILLKNRTGGEELKKVMELTF
jgi:GWxTD domain-containing protein